MGAREIKALVDDFESWRGNAYTLAALVAQAQKDADAALAESAGQPELAAAIRSQ